jgi:hypothetical protein
VCVSKPATGGAVLVNWGRADCPASSTLLYSSVAAGAFYNDYGGGTTYLCPSNRPDFVNVPFDSRDVDVGRIWRVEYETADDPVPFKALQNHDVPCAVCQRSADLPHELWVPGTATCPAGFAQLYAGQMMAEHYNLHKGSFVCVNAQPQSGGSPPDQNSGRMYAVISYPTAPLPGYKPFFELECSVCSGYAVGSSPPPPLAPPGVVPQGETYVRWGRRSCPLNSQLVYVGVAGGSWFGQNGNGADMQCLPPSATFQEGMYDSADSSTADIYRAEYETSGSGLGSSFDDLHNMEVPCAVCQRLKRSRATMVAGTYVCPAGFSADYTGYLFASPSFGRRSEHICIDKDAVGVGSVANENGMLLTPVEAGPSSILGYDQREITCAVCSTDTAFGSIFVHNGRRDCPSRAKRLFSGQLAGSEVSGGGANYLCMVDEPLYRTASAAANSANADLASLEYGAQPSASASGFSAYARVRGFIVPCAVCQNPDANEHSFVNSGRQDCPAGFSEDFHGFLMAPAHTQWPGSFVCVSDAPQTLGTATGNLGEDIFFVETQAPQVPGYVVFREISCAHCSSNAGGSVFPAWGVSTCPPSTTTLYASSAAGAHYAHSGSGVEYLCPNPFPDYTNVPFDAADNTGAIVYQTEYETSDAGFGRFRSLHNYEVPCAMCQRPAQFPLGITVPASYVCPANFQPLYRGFLMSSHASHTSKKTWICMNENAEASGSLGNGDGALVYMTEIVNAGIPRDSYIDGYVSNKELNCVVCSACRDGTVTEKKKKEK